MADPRPVLTIFAGPNGSGKSSLYGKIFEAGHLRAGPAGYDVRLYFVSTENSRLNVERVRKRVREGGHDVPTEKVIARYRRSLALLPKACEFVDEATLFDNSGLEMRAVVQFQRDRNGAPHIIIVKPLPRWIVEFLRQILPLIGRLSGRPA